jgi:hypothetical protein
MADNYDDIINLPRHVSDHHPHMSMSDRAAQFSPFAALTGYGDLVDETARYTEERPTLTESEREELDAKLQQFLLNSWPGTQLRSLTFFRMKRKRVDHSRSELVQSKKLTNLVKKLFFLMGTGSGLRMFLT